MAKGRALVIGGGIGGLSAAIAIARAGYEPVVYEQADELREIGAGVAIWSNAYRALEALGLGDSLAAVTSPLTSVETRRKDGRVLQSMPIGELDSKSGAPSVGFHRRELLSLLADQISPDAIVTGARFETLHQDENGVTARFQDGREDRGDILIGADGIFSAVRSQILGDVAVDYGGYVVWRGVGEFEPATTYPRHASVRSLSRDQHFGIVELSRNRFFWYATRNQPHDDPEPGGRKETLRRLFSDWHDPIPAVLEATPEEEMLRHGLFRIRTLRSWTDRRVTLLGDAAHPMAPSLGQGACQAIEDGVVIGHCLGANADPKAALADYERKRLPRARSVVRWSRFFAATEQFRNPVICAARDLQTALTPKTVALRLWRPFVTFEPPSLGVRTGTPPTMSA